MLFPDYKIFPRLAATSTLVPVAKPVTADLRTPVSAFLNIAAEEPNAFLLESVEGGEKVGRHTFLGVRPYMILRGRGTEITLERAGRTQKIEGNVFAIVDQLLREHTPAKVAGLPPFTAGAVGFFAHDAVRQLEKLPVKAKDDLQIPDCVLMFFDRLLAFDHVRHEIYIIASAAVRRQSQRKTYDLALRDIEQIEKQLTAPLPRKYLRPARPKTGKLKVNISVSKKHFVETVEKIKEYIFAGDVFQAVPSLRLEFEPGLPPFNIYRALRRGEPSPGMCLLRIGEASAGGSPPGKLWGGTRSQRGYRPLSPPPQRGRETAGRPALGAAPHH